jgi:hypothetical protein
MTLKINDYYVETLAIGIEKVKLICLTENSHIVVDNVREDNNIYPLVLFLLAGDRVDPLSRLGAWMNRVGISQLTELTGKDIDVEFDNVKKKYYIS